MPYLTKNNSNYFNVGVFIAIILAGLALYFVPLQSASFYYDDHLTIEHDAAIKTIDISNIFHVFNTRFLVGLSFALNYKFCALNPAGYRLINLLIHCLNAFLVYLLVKLTLGLIDIRHPEPARDSSLLGLRMTPKLQWPAFFAALLFLCHPIQTEAVNLITQRFVLMGALFYLASLYFYVKSRLLQDSVIASEAKQSFKEIVTSPTAPHNDTFLIRKIYYIFSLITALAAMFCKEFVVTLPFMLALYDFYFLSAWAKTWWQRCSRILPFFLIALIVPVLLLKTGPQTILVANIAKSNFVPASNTQKVQRHIDITRARNSISRPQYFLTQMHVVSTYIRLLFWPFNQNFDYDYPISSQWDKKTILCGVFLLYLLALAIAIHKSYRLVSFGILWFFVSLSVESSFIPIGDVIAEYRLYLASVGFVILVMSLIYSRPEDQKRLNMIAAAILIGFSILTYQRNKVWRNEFTLWNDTVVKSPHKARAYNNRGNVFYRQGHLTRALYDYNKAIEVNPNYAEAYINRGRIYDTQNNSPQAMLDYNRAIRLNPNYAEVYNNRGNIYVRQGNFTLGLSDFNKAIELNPDYAEAYYNRGLEYYDQGNFINAISDYNKAIELNPKIAQVYNNRGLVYYNQGRLTQAISDFDKAIGTNPDYAVAYNNRGLVFYNQGRFINALSDYNKAIEIKPDYSEAYNNRGLVYFMLGNLTQSISDYNKAIDLNPNVPEEFNNRGFCYGVQGNFTQALSDYNRAIALNPKFAIVYRNRALVYDHLKEYDKAWGDVNKAEGLGAPVDPNFKSKLKRLRLR